MANLLSGILCLFACLNVITVKVINLRRARLSYMCLCLKYVLIDACVLIAPYVALY